MRDQVTQFLRPDARGGIPHRLIVCPESSSPWARYATFLQGQQETERQNKVPDERKKLKESACYTEKQRREHKKEEKKLGTQDSATATSETTMMQMLDTPPP